MNVTASTLAKITGTSVNDNMLSVIAGLNAYPSGLDAPHRLAHFIAQVAHESAGFRYDREIWGNTAAQQRYDTRTDLGNTPERDGDGKKYMGRTAMQITGKANVRAFRDWCRAKLGNCPDFVANPDAMNTNPWEGLGPIWYWETRALNALADANNLKAITKKINGGYNGLADRQNWYVRAALVLLGRGPHDVKTFQKSAGLAVDGVAGQQTLAALHGALKGLKPATPAAPKAKPRSTGRSGAMAGALLAIIIALAALLGFDIGGNNGNDQPAVSTPDE